MTVATNGAGTAILPEFTPVCFSGGCVAWSLVFCVVFCRSLFVLLYFLYWSLCCLFLFDLRILIIPLVSSTSPFVYFGIFFPRFVLVFWLNFTLVEFYIVSGSYLYSTTSLCLLTKHSRSSLFSQTVKKHIN
jgi:hypothetical protein